MDNTVKEQKLPGRVPVAKAAGSKSLTEPSGSDRPTYTGGATNTTHARATDDLGKETGLNNDSACGLATTTVSSFFTKNTVVSKEVDLRSEDDEMASVTSADSANTLTRLVRKRSYAALDKEKKGGSASDSSEKTPRAPKEKPTLKKGRVGPPTPLSRASSPEVMVVEIDRSLADAAGNTDNFRCSRLSLASTSELDADELTALELKKKLEDSVAAIKTVAKVSKGLKGTCQKTLKNAATSIMEMAEELLQRTASEETKRLQAQNRRLKAQLEELSKEMTDLRADITAMKEKERPREKTPNPPLEQTELARLFKEEIGKVLSRVEFLEGRILRPPLASDSRPSPTATTSYSQKVSSKRSSEKTHVPAGTPAVPPAVPSAAPTATDAQAKSAPKPLKGQKKKAAPKPSTTSAGQAAPKPSQGEWQTVGDAKKNKKARKKAAKKKKKEANRLRPPTTTAVVLTLQPGAEERGVTYAGVLGRAKEAINLEELGITGLRCKLTATGARMLELPGATSGSKADALAEKLRATIHETDVRVSRPTKTANMRLIGLDDSATKEEIVSAVAKTGECPETEIKVGEIRRGRKGLGTAIITCPVGVAQKLVDRKTLLVGWVSVEIKLLKPRPVRCFCCLLDGHVGTQCTFSVNSRDRCFRCGQPGHKADTCSATPHCLVCAEAKKPAEHLVGSKDCASNKTTKKKAPPVTPIKRPKAAPVVPSGTEDRTMDTN